MLGVCVFGTTDGLKLVGWGCLQEPSEALFNAVDIHFMEPGEGQLAWLAIRGAVEGRRAWLLAACAPARDHRKRKGFWGAGIVFREEDIGGSKVRYAMSQVGDVVTTLRGALDPQTQRLDLAHAQSLIEDRHAQLTKEQASFHYARNARATRVVIGPPLRQRKSADIIATFLASKQARQSEAFFVTDADLAAHEIWFDGQSEAVLEQDLLERIDELEKEKDTLEKENYVLKQEIATLKGPAKKRKLVEDEPPPKARPEAEPAPVWRSEPTFSDGQGAHGGRGYPSTDVLVRADDHQRIEAAPFKRGLHISTRAAAAFAGIAALLMLGFWVGPRVGAGLSNLAASKAITESPLPPADLDRNSPSSIRDAGGEAPDAALLELYRRLDDKRFGEAKLMDTSAAYADYRYEFDVPEPYRGQHLEEARVRIEQLAQAQTGADLMARLQLNLFALGLMSEAREAEPYAKTAEALKRLRPLARCELGVSLADPARLGQQIECVEEVQARQMAVLRPRLELVETFFVDRGALRSGARPEELQRAWLNALESGGEPLNLVSAPEFAKGVAKVVQASMSDNLKSIQNSLTSLRYYDGEVDGSRGPGTKEAWSAFLKDHGRKLDVPLNTKISGDFQTLRTQARILQDAAERPDDYAKP